MRVPLEITLQFRTNGFYVNASDEIYVRMPRFTSGDGSGAAGPSFEVHQHSWATLFQLFWHEHEHTASQSEPFPLANLTLRVREGRVVEPTRAYEVTRLPAIVRFSRPRPHCLCLFACLLARPRVVRS